MTGVANNHYTYHVGNCVSEKFFIQSLKFFWLFSKCQFYVYLFWVFGHCSARSQILEQGLGVCESQNA